MISGLGSLAGAAFLGGAPRAVLALVNAVAPGALLTTVSETMLPEAIEGEHGATGLPRRHRPAPRRRNLSGGVEF
jgi:ZIP family zinc transporter